MPGKKNESDFLVKVDAEMGAQGTLPFDEIDQSARRAAKSMSKAGKAGKKATDTMSKGAKKAKDAHEKLKKKIIQVQKREQALAKQTRISAHENVSALEKWARWLGYLITLYATQRFTTALASLTSKAKEFRMEAAKVQNLGAPIAKVREALTSLDPVYSNQKVLMQNYFRVHSGGITDVNDALAVTKAAAKAAFAEQANLIDVTRAGIKMWNIYGSELRDASQAFDILSETARFGDTDLQAIASSIAEILPLSKALGQSIFTTTGAFSLLTRSQKDTSVAATNLASLYRSFTNDTKEAQDAASELSIIWDANILRVMGLEGVLGYLKRALDETNISQGRKIELLRSMTGRVEAMNALLALLGDQYEQVDDAIEATTNSQGAIIEKALNMEEAIGVHERFANTWENIQTKMGEEFIPTFETFTRILQNNADALPGIIKGMLAFGVSLMPFVMLERINRNFAKATKGMNAMQIAAFKGERSIKRVKAAFVGLRIAMQAAVAMIALHVIGEWIGFMQRAHEEATRLTEHTKKLIDEQEEQAHTSRQQIRQFVELRNKENMLAKETEKLTKLTEDLAKRYPDLSSSLNDASVSAESLAAAMNKIIAFNKIKFGEQIMDETQAQLEWMQHQFDENEKRWQEMAKGKYQGEKYSDAENSFFVKWLANQRGTMQRQIWDLENAYKLAKSWVDKQRALVAKYGDADWEAQWNVQGTVWPWLKDRSYAVADFKEALDSRELDVALAQVMKKRFENLHAAMQENAIIPKHIKEKWTSEFEGFYGILDKIIAQGQKAIEDRLKKQAELINSFGSDAQKIAQIKEKYELSRADAKSHFSGADRESIMAGIDAAEMKEINDLLGISVEKHKEFIELFGSEAEKVALIRAEYDEYRKQAAQLHGSDLPALAMRLKEVNEQEQKQIDSLQQSNYQDWVENFGTFDLKLRELNRTYIEQKAKLEALQPSQEGYAEKTELLIGLEEKHKKNIESLNEEFGKSGREQEEFINSMIKSYGGLDLNIALLEREFSGLRTQIDETDASAFKHISKVELLTLLDEGLAIAIAELTKNFRNEREELESLLAVAEQVNEIFGSMSSIFQIFGLPDISGITQGIGSFQKGFETLASVKEAGGWVESFGKANAYMQMALGGLSIFKNLFGGLFDSSSFNKASVERFGRSLGVQFSESLVSGMMSRIDELLSMGFDKFRARTIAEMEAIPEIIEEMGGRLEQAQFDQLLWKVSHAIEALGNSSKTFMAIIPSLLALIDQVEQGFVQWTDHLSALVSGTIRAGVATEELLTRAVALASDDNLRAWITEVQIGLSDGTVSAQAFKTSLEAIFDEVENRGIDVIGQFNALLGELLDQWQQTQEWTAPKIEIDPAKFRQELEDALGDYYDPGTVDIPPQISAGDLMKDMLVLLAASNRLNIDITQDFDRITAAIFEAYEQGADVADFIAAIQELLTAADRLGIDLTGRYEEISTALHQALLDGEIDIENYMSTLWLMAENAEKFGYDMSAIFEQMRETIEQALADGTLAADEFVEQMIANFDAAMESGVNMNWFIDMMRYGFRLALEEGSADVKAFVEAMIANFDKATIAGVSFHKQVNAIRFSLRRGLAEGLLSGSDLLDLFSALEEKGIVLAGAMGNIMSAIASGLKQGLRSGTLEIQDFKTALELLAEKAEEYGFDITGSINSMIRQVGKDIIKGAGDVNYLTQALLILLDVAERSGVNISRSIGAASRALVKAARSGEASIHLIQSSIVTMFKIMAASDNWSNRAMKNMITAAKVMGLTWRDIRADINAVIRAQRTLVQELRRELNQMMRDLPANIRQAENSIWSLYTRMIDLNKDIHAQQQSIIERIKSGKATITVEGKEKTLDMATYNRIYQALMQLHQQGIILPEQFEKLTQGLDAATKQMLRDLVTQLNNKVLLQDQLIEARKTRARLDRDAELAKHRFDREMAKYERMIQARNHLRRRLSTLQGKTNTKLDTANRHLAAIARALGRTVEKKPKRPNLPKRPDTDMSFDMDYIQPVPQYTPPPAQPAATETKTIQPLIIKLPDGRTAEMKLEISDNRIKKVAKEVLFHGPDKIPASRIDTKR